MGFAAAKNGIGVALIPKVGSSTLAFALVRAHWPQISNPRPAAGVQSQCPKVRDVAGVILLVPIRDPVERFRAACAQTGAAGRVEQLLAEMEQAPGREPRDIHFRRQCWSACQPTAGAVRLYRFPDHLEQLAGDAGLEWPLPKINAARREKPTLTDEQAARVRRFYGNDLAIFSTINAPAQEFYDPL